MYEPTFSPPLPPADSPSQNWKTSKKFQYSLLSDPSRVLLKQLGATEAKKCVSILCSLMEADQLLHRRCHWVIEKGGKLLEAKIGVKPADDPKNTCVLVGPAQRFTADERLRSLAFIKSL